MAVCRAHKQLKLGGELNCDLDNDHESLLSFHYDKAEDVEWRDGRVPVAVPYTPTGPLRKLQEQK